MNKESSVPKLKSLYADNPEAKSKNSLRAWLYLMKCAKRIEQEMSGRLRVDYKSSMSRFDVLAHLYFAGPKGLSTSHLAKLLLTSKGNITRLLDRKVQDGLLERKANARDRRISEVFLSDAGTALFERMAPDHESWSDEMFGILSDKEINELVRMLRSVHHELEAQ